MRIGILGAGQLGRMLAQAARSLGIETRFLAPMGETCVEGLGELVQGTLRDPALLDRFAVGLDAVTLEWENVPTVSLQYLSRRLPVRPGPRSLQVGQDRVQEKQFFAQHGLRVQPFAPVDGPRDFTAALQAVPLPAMLTTRRMGYDGRGQARVNTPADLAAASEWLGGVPCILEQFVAFTQEVSLVCVRGLNAQDRADIRFWSPCANRHQQGILDRTVAPARLPPAVLEQATAGVRRVVEALGHEGVLCVEFFLDAHGLVANEMAPRVHNSGHWTIEGAVTSQFENHMRAVARMPLGSTEARGISVMRNLIGQVPNPGALLPAGTHLHLYGKQPRPGRKLGHVTSVAQLQDDALSASDAAFAALQGQPASARG